MIDLNWKFLIFLKDFTERGGDLFYWVKDGEIFDTCAADIVAFKGTIVCHDFWLIRDTLFDVTRDLPKSLIDLDELRITVSGNPEDRVARERSDITAELTKYGASSEVCSVYKKMFNRGVDFDSDVAIKAATAMAKMFLALLEIADSDGELERFMDVEVPIYHILQKSMSAGITINTTDLSSKRREAEYDYFYCLKNYSSDHDMPLETPTRATIEAQLYRRGFDLSGVSVDYILDFLPHNDDFGSDTIALWEFDASKRVLSSIALSSGRTRPVIDVFGARTSRIHLRSPSLQNLAKKYRSIVSAREGAELCYVDFDQYEVGIMAALSGDLKLLELYRSGDMYEKFSKNHLGLAGNRKAAKQLFLSYAYGMSRKALIDAAVSLGADRKRAKAAFNIFSKYEEWKKTIWAAFLEDGRVATIGGNHYKRNSNGILSAKEQRSAISQVVQGTASLIFKKALLESDKIEDVTIVLPMHDAILFEHRLAETPQKVVVAFEKVMTSELSGRVNGKASIGEFFQN